jgi:hypothetical protein
MRETRFYGPSEGSSTCRYIIGVPTIYRSSRLTSGNRIFPSSITIDGDQITYRKNRWFGSTEEAINCSHVASLRSAHGMIWSKMTIETSGGSQPIVITGLSRNAAEAIEAVVRKAQGGTIGQTK